MRDTGNNIRGLRRWLRGSIKRVGGVIGTGGLVEVEYKKVRQDVASRVPFLTGRMPDYFEKFQRHCRIASLFWCRRQMRWRLGVRRSTLVVMRKKKDG